MPDPVTIGVLAATALGVAAKAAVDGAVGEAAKEAYQALKARVARWAGADVEALEKSPHSDGRRSVVAEAVDAQPADEQAAVRALAEQLIAALKSGGAGNVGLDIGRLEAMDVQLGPITVTEGTGARIDEARVKRTFKTEKISVGRQKIKKKR